MMMRSRNYPARLAASIGLVLLFAAATARAEDETATRSVAVSLNDLDLASVGGRVLAQRRIDVAARQVCEAADINHLRVGADYLRCRSLALGGASSQLRARVIVARTRRPSVTVTDTVTP